MAHHAIGYYTAATGRDVNQFQYMAMGIPTGIVLVLLLLLVFKFVFRPADIGEISPSKAMALRGIAAGRGALLRHPVQSLEYILMPLLMNGNNVAQDLSVAALTKGIGLPGTHTCMVELKLTVWDFVYPALCTLPLLWKGGILF